MAIDFPTSKYTVADGTSQNSWPGSPSSGDTATANSYTYTYNGTLWVMNNGSTKSFTGGATYTWDGEKWDASNIPDNSNVVQAPSSGWVNGELLQYNGTTWDSVDLIIDEDNMSSDLDTKIPTQQSVKSYVDNQVASVVDSAPATLDTLNELAAALNDDANFATTVTTNLAAKLDASSVSTFGGTLIDDADAATARTTLGLGTAATSATGDFATAAQGTKADSAIQPADLSTVATSGSYTDLSNQPTIPSATSDLTNDSGFITADATKLPLAGGTMNGDIAMGSNKVTGLGTPSATGDAATKGYVDTQISASGGGTVTNVSGTAPISVTNGTTTPAISISAATTSAAGTMSSSDKSKLDGIAAGAEVNVATNLGQTTGTNSLTLTSSTGNNVTVAEASSSIAGLMSTAHHNKLDGIAAGAEVNVQSDWNASSGDAAILNKPTIPTNNNQLTNGAGYITSADGGNADTVDSLHASSFLRSDANDTYTGTALTINAASSSNYFEVRNGSDTDNYMRMYCESNTTKVGDTFSGNTDKRYIHFNNPNGSNDPGFIMHETRADDSGLEINEGVLHLVPSDENEEGDYVSIHGTNDPDCLKLHTSGLIETASGYTLNLNSGSGSVSIGGNTAWHAGNDGSGSGLDADTLDGQHGSYYNNYNNLSNKPTLYTNSSVDSHLNTSSASSGGTLTWNGSDYAWSAASGGGGADVQEFTSSGTWTKPSGCSIVEVHVFGAGGGGGGGGTTGGAVTASTSGNCFIPSGGGGGGSYVRYTFEASDLGSTVSVTVGAGGSGGSGTGNTSVYNHGSTGGNSSFGTLVALGGMGGPSSVFIPDHYNLDVSSIKSAYNYPEALDSGLRRPGQRFALWYYSAFPNYMDVSAFADALQPPAGGNGGGGIDYQNVVYTTHGLGAQGMYQAFVSTGQNGITQSSGINAGAPNANPGTNASINFQSGNGGAGRNAVVAAIMDAGNGGRAAGGGGGGSSVNVGMSGGNGGTGGSGYVIVRSW